MNNAGRNQADSGRTLEFLHQFSAAQTAQEVESIFSRYLEAALPGAYGAIWILDESETPRTLLRVAEFNRRGASLGPLGATLPVGKGLVGGAIERGQARELHLESEADYKLLADPDFFRARGLTSVLALPFSLADVPGAVMVGVASRLTFSDDLRAHIYDAARLATAYIVRLRRVEVDELLTQLLRLDDGRGEPPLLAAYCRLVKQCLRVDGAWVAFRDGESTSLRIVASSAGSTDTRFEKATLFARVGAWDRPIRLHNTIDREKVLPWHGDPSGTWSGLEQLDPVASPAHHLMIAPLRIAGRSKGCVLVTRQPEASSFLNFELDAFFASASHLAVLLDRLRVLGNQSRMVEIASSLFSAHSPSAAMDAILVGLADLFQTQRAFVLLKDAKSHRWTISRSLVEQQLDDSIYVVDDALVAFEGTRAAHISLVASHTLLGGIGNNVGWAEAKAPILRGDDLLGAIVLQSRSPADLMDRWERSSRLLTLLANQLAVALSEIRTRTEARRLERQIDDIGNHASAASIAVAITHELKSALNTVSLTVRRLKTFERVLASRAIPAAEARAMSSALAHIQRDAGSEIERVTGLMKDVREIALGSEVIPGRMRHPGRSREVLWLNDVVTPFVRLLTEPIQLGRVELKYEGDPRLSGSQGGARFAVKASRATIAQILINLVDNAVDASNGAGRVDILTEVEHCRGLESAVLRVRDFGVGMSKETLASAFQMFWTTKDKGTGLGLPMVKRLVEADGARLSVESHEGAGTTISVAWELISDKA